MTTFIPESFSWSAVQADQSRQWRDGRGVLVEEYLRRWPHLRTETEILLDLISHEIILRNESGEKPTLLEYLGRFPDLSEEMVHLFAQPRSKPAAAEAPALRRRARSAPLPAPSIPGYEIIAFIDSGGQGDVYQARHLLLDRLVALKILRLGPDTDAEQLARFQREGQVSARLDHPNIIRVFDCQEHEGRLYFCMEFADAGSLKDRLDREGCLRPRDTAELLVTLALAVQHAHDHAVIHRDLKPSNALFLSDGTVKIADFGLAKLLNPDVTELTRTHAVLGSASYMSPEQAAGRNRLITAATDIYGLGAILYETLTGQPPFRGESWLATLDLVRFEPVTPPRHWQPDIPPELERICLKCLEKDPSRRYRRAAELAADLRRFLEDELLQTRDATLDTPPPEEARSAEPLTSSPLPSTTPAIDERGFPLIPGYEILNLIGRGGMGMVYLARQVSLHRLVALKTIAENGEGAARWRRLRAEAEVVAGLKHPNIVQIHDLNEYAGLVYVAMEYVEGGSLWTTLRHQGPPPPRAAAQLIEQVARAVGFIHLRRLVHRDIKPSNILLAPAVLIREQQTRIGGLTADQLFGIPKLTDFGLVRRLDDICPDPEVSGDGDQFSTMAGAVVGTPLYMSPEQAAGRNADVGFASDVWALGVTLFEVLTGQTPFAASNFVEVLHNVMAGRPVGRPRELRPDIPPVLEAICLKCLQPEPRQRYANGQQLAEDLWSFLEDRPTLAAPPGFWQRLLFWRIS
jgi:serine/threonine protein kinase